MSAAPWYPQHVSELVDALTSTDASALPLWGSRLAARLAAGGRLLAAGNGGSAAQAQHLTAELVGRFARERRPWSAIALTAETSSLTAIVNDYGADELFARQVEAHGRPGDVLVLLSTSGHSPNVVRAAERGRALGLQVWAFTGPGPNPLAAAADEAVCVPAASTAAVQAVHLVLLHALCAALDEHPVTGPVAQDAPGELDAPADLADQSVPAARTDLGTPTGAEVADKRPHLVVVGDVVLDRDIDGRTDRLCPDAPAPVLDVRSSTQSPGGAGLAALLAAADGARVTLVAPLAEDEEGAGLHAALRTRVAVLRLGHEGPTRRKVRVRTAGRSLVRIDDGGPGTPTHVPSDELAQVLGTADAVLVCDYGAGVTRDPAVRDALAQAARTRPLVWDPHPRGGPPVEGCALVTPNLEEARAAAQTRSSDLLAEGGSPATEAGATGPDQLADRLRTSWQVRAVAVTAGPDGAYLASGAPVTSYLPAPRVDGQDTCGAGDSLAATAAVALARGALVGEAVEAAVARAAAWVAAGGAEAFRRTRPDEQAGGAAAAPDPAAAPAPTPADERPAQLAALAARLRGHGGTLVSTGGCFDIVHAGHIATLQAARRLGDALVVLLNSDESVRRLKGPGRPVVPAADRARVLAALDCVDAVVVFDEDDPSTALRALAPDVWAKGGDYGGAELPEAATVHAGGGRIVTVPYLDGRSTTSLIERSARSRPSTDQHLAPQHTRPQEVR